MTGPLPEPHYSPKSLAEFLSVSEKTILRWFQDEPGVVRLGEERVRNGKRTRQELRIPYSVFARVYSRRTNAQ